MRTLFATLSQLVLGLWLGSLVFFVAVVTRVAFFGPLRGLFPNAAAGTHAAGLVVGGSLVGLHYLGLICGVLFILFTLILSRFAHWHSYTPQVLLVLVMMVLTAYSQFFIIPRMDTARDSVGGEIAAVPENNPGREIFDRLHVLSTRIEGAVVVCGFVAFLLGGRPRKPRTLL
jgi:hypothetical protein